MSSNDKVAATFHPAETLPDRLRHAAQYVGAADASLMEEAAARLDQRPAND